MSKKNFKTKFLVSRFQKAKDEQRGTALIFTIIVVSFMILIIFSMTLLILPRLVIIREASNSVAAIYAADSAIEWCIYEIRTAGDLVKPVMSSTYWSGTYLPVPNYTITDLVSGIPGDDCPLNDSYNHRAVGTYGGVSRALELQQSP